MFLFHSEATPRKLYPDEIRWGQESGRQLSFGKQYLCIDQQTILALHQEKQQLEIYNMTRDVFSLLCLQGQTDPMITMWCWLEKVVWESPPS